jgi:hypothetical protein
MILMKTQFRKLKLWVGEKYQLLANLNILGTRLLTNRKYKLSPIVTFSKFWQYEIRVGKA